MDFLEKIGDSVNAKGREAAVKAKELAQIVGLKRQKSTCEDVIKKNYMEIGKLYYELHGDMPEAAFEKQCRAIRNAKKGVEDLQQQINDVKGL